MINYIPKLESINWSLKCQRSFDSVETMKAFIAEKLTAFYHYIGHTEKYFHPHDIKITSIREYDCITGLYNFCEITLNGFVAGYCGE